MRWLLNFWGKAIARFLSHPSATYRPLATSSFGDLDANLRPGDVLLVEGNTRIAGAIKYLTQSTWSHAALCIGRDESGENLLVEADLIEGVRVVRASTYADFHTRICRPTGLSDDDVRLLVELGLRRIGNRYDLKNLFDLARYLLPLPLPASWRRRALMLGSGEPTRAICSTFIAQLFEVVNYPVLPQVERRPNGDCNTCYDEILKIRHHTLYAPRDFDVSPYFAVVKPALEKKFDFRSVHWDRPAVPADARVTVAGSRGDLTSMPAIR
jgi:hypothetical protein